MEGENIDGEDERKGVKTDCEEVEDENIDGEDEGRAMMEGRSKDKGKDVKIVKRWKMKALMVKIKGCEEMEDKNNDGEDEGRLMMEGRSKDSGQEEELRFMEMYGTKTRMEMKIKTQVVKKEEDDRLCVSDTSCAHCLGTFAPTDMFSM